MRKPKVVPPDVHRQIVVESEQHNAPAKPSAEEIFKALDDAGARDFELERDLSLPVERDLF